MLSGAVLGDEQIFEHRHAAEQADILEGARHAGGRGNFVALHPFQQKRRLAGRMVEGDHALGRLVEAGDAVEDRCLARAVRPDESGDLAAPGREGEIVDRDQPAKAHGQVVNLQDCAVARTHPAPSLTSDPEMDLRSLSATVASREPTRPRGRQTMMVIIEAPKISIR